MESQRERNQFLPRGREIEREGGRVAWRERGREVRLVRVPDPVLACGRVDARVSEREKQKKIHFRHARCVGDINASKVSAGSANCVSPGSEREPVALKKRVVIEEMNCQQILP